jgi:anti-sigma regulatory factor (Ser/Thr protein kinase)
MAHIPRIPAPPGTACESTACESTACEGTAFFHTALIVDSDTTVRGLLAPAVRRATTEADLVFLTVSAGTARLLRDELGPAADTLGWGDTAAVYQRLGFAYEAFRRYLAAAHAAGRRVHVFAEPDLVEPPGGQPAGPPAVDRAAAYLAYEAICNETYAGYGCEVTCLWDARRHPAPMIDSVRALHSHRLGPGGREPSPGYASPRDFLAGCNQRPLPLPVEADLAASLGGVEGLPGLRAQLRGLARDRGYAASAVADVTVAVNEIATNGLSHGRPPVEVRAWQHGDTLVVQVDDSGGTPLPAAGGYEPPDEHQERTRGLWLARQLADVMQTHTDRGTTSVRLYFPYQLTHRRPPFLSTVT